MTYSLLGTAAHTGEQIRISQSARRQGLYIIGGTGQGKTGLIENLIVQDIEQGLGVAVLDPHGDLVNSVIARMSEERIDDVVLLDITHEEHPFGLNLFACDNPNSTIAVQYVVDQVMHIFEKLFDVNTAGTPLLLQYLRNCTYTLIANPGFTMADISLLLTEKLCRQILVANVKNIQVKRFWQNFERLSPKDQQEEWASLERRLDVFLQPLTYNIVGQSNTTINLRQIMDGRKILFVMLNARLEGVTSLIGSTLIALMLNAAYSRTDIEQKRRRQFNIYADEFQRFATEDFATLFTEARKFGIATTIAHQTFSQVSQKNRDAALQAANLVVFKVTGSDAQELATNFDATPPPFQVKKSISQNPLDYLLNQTHPNAEVRELTQTWLSPLVNKTKQENYKVRRYNSFIEQPEFLVKYPQTWISKELTCSLQDFSLGMFALRQLLVGVMEHRIPLGSPAFVESTQTLLYSWRALIGWADIFVDFYKWKYDDESTPIFGIPDQRTMDALKQFVTLLVSDYSQRTQTWSVATRAACDEFLSVYLKNMWEDKPYHSGWDDRDKRWAEGATEAIALFVSRLYRLCELLAHEPIEVSYGVQDEPHMTYADMLHLIANKLTTLQPFTAYAKVVTEKGTVEHTIHTLAPGRSVGRKELEKRKEQILANNLRAGYVRNREEVIAEIEARQQGCTDTLPQTRFRPERDV